VPDCARDAGAQAGAFFFLAVAQEDVSVVDGAVYRDDANDANPTFATHAVRDDVDAGCGECVDQALMLGYFQGLVVIADCDRLGGAAGFGPRNELDEPRIFGWLGCATDGGEPKADG
jgi:hypothetical protein